MRHNRGATTLKRRRRRHDPMRDFDRLPPALRTWLANAALPWGPRSAGRAFDRAIAATGDAALALQELDRLQHRLVQKDAQRIWGPDYPVFEAPPSGRAPTAL
ncbi:MAG: DUF6525 family protein [Pseudomonadota bacterium]